MAKKGLSCDCEAVHLETVALAAGELPEERTLAAAAAFFRALADPTRAKILWALDRRELCVCDLCALLDMTKSAVSHQLAYLRSARLVSPRRDGKTVFYSLADEHVREIFETAVEHINEKL